mgnify:CR=1 FL=1
MAYDASNEMLKVGVADEGKGIKVEEMDKLFSMFGKLRRTAEINSEGIGMGLMICQNLVKMNHGSISAYSQGENKGSIFSFTMQMKLKKEANKVKQLDLSEEHLLRVAEDELKYLQ